MYYDEGALGARKYDKADIALLQMLHTLMCQTADPERTWSECGEDLAAAAERAPYWDTLQPQTVPMHSRLGRQIMGWLAGGAAIRLRGAGGRRNRGYVSG